MTGLWQYIQEDGEYFVNFLETIGKIPNRFKRTNQHDSSG